MRFDFECFFSLFIYLLKLDNVSLLAHWNYCVFAFVELLALELLFSVFNFSIW